MANILKYKQMNLSHRLFARGTEVFSRVVTAARRLELPYGNSLMCTERCRVAKIIVIWNIF